MKQLFTLLIFTALFISSKCGKSESYPFSYVSESELQEYPDSVSVEDLFRLATIFTDSCNTKQAIYANREILARTASKPFDPPRGEVYMRLALAYYHLGEFDQSLKNLIGALEFYQHNADSIQQARVLNNLANIYSRYGDYDLALEYYYACLDIFKRVGLEKEISITYANIGYIKGELKEFDEGLIYLEKSLELSEEAGIRDIIGQLHIIGYNYRKQEQPHLAITYYTRALRTARELESHWNIIRSLNNLGSVFTETGRYSQAEAHLTESRNILQDADFKELQKDNYVIFSQLYEKTGRPTMALEYYKKYEALKDDLFSKEKLKIISEIKTVHEIERREQEIKLLRAQNEMYDQEINARKARYRLLLTGGIIVFLLLGFLYIESRQKTGAYRQLVLKNLEIIEKEKSGKHFPHNIIMTEVISRGEENLIAENHLPEEAPEEASSGRYSSSSLSETQKILLEQQIKFQFEKKKIYTDPELSLDKVAGILDTNNKYISQIINESFNSNFINFVNEFRIREARILLADPSYNQYTIETVAEMVGFKSKSAFNRAFKRITGLTPSFFQKTTIETHQFPETVMA